MTSSESIRRTNRRDARAIEIIARAAAQFIVRETGSGSLITVTRAQSAAHGKRIIVFVNVFPEEKIHAALSFLERQREAFSDYLKDHVHLSSLPRIDFLLDDGERGRQILDDLLQNS